MGSLSCRRWRGKKEDGLVPNNDWWSSTTAAHGLWRKTTKTGWNASWRIMASATTTSVSFSSSSSSLYYRHHFLFMTWTGALQDRVRNPWPKMFWCISVPLARFPLYFLFVFRFSSASSSGSFALWFWWNVNWHLSSMLTGLSNWLLKMHTHRQVRRVRLVPSQWAELCNETPKNPPQKVGVLCSEKMMAPTEGAPKWMMLLRLFNLALSLSYRLIAASKWHQNFEGLVSF